MESYTLLAKLAFSFILVDENSLRGESVPHTCARDNVHGTLTITAIML